MNLKSKLVTLAIAATVVVGSAAGAFAHYSGGGAIVDHSTPLYSKPGYNKIGWVSGGTWVYVGGCYDGYCWISKPGKDGFVPAWDLDWHYSDWDYGDHHDHHHDHDHGHGPVVLVP